MTEDDILEAAGEIEALAPLDSTTEDFATAISDSVKSFLIALRAVSREDECAERPAISARAERPAVGERSDAVISHWFDLVWGARRQSSSLARHTASEVVAM